jgi:hypothetical protein
MAGERVRDWRLAKSRGEEAEREPSALLAHWHCHAWPLLTLRFGVWRRIRTTKPTVETRLSLYLDLAFSKTFQFVKTLSRCHCHFRSTSRFHISHYQSRRVARPTLLQLHVAWRPTPRPCGCACPAATREARERVRRRRAPRGRALVLVPESRVKYEVCVVSRAESPAPELQLDLEKLENRPVLMLLFFHTTLDRQVEL